MAKHEQQRLQSDCRPIQLERSFGEILRRERTKRSIVLRTGPPVRLHAVWTEPGFQFVSISNGQLADSVEPQRSQGHTQFVRDRQKRQWQGRQKSRAGTRRHDDRSLVVHDPPWKRPPVRLTTVQVSCQHGSGIRYDGHVSHAHPGSDEPRRERRLPKRANQDGFPSPAIPSPCIHPAGCRSQRSYAR